MARAFYSYEIGDQDLDWLVSNFLCEHPDYISIELGNLPIVLLTQSEELWDSEDYDDFKDEELEERLD